MPAPNIKLGTDAGAVAFIDGIVYRRLPDQPQLGQVSKSIQAGDVLNIQPYTWNYDDSRVLGGANHRTWSAEEMGVATHIYGAQITHRTRVWDTLSFTAPISGVIRIWGSNCWKLDINGFTYIDRMLGWPRSDSISQGDALVFGLVPDDYMLLSVYHPSNPMSPVYYRFLPDVYSTGE